MEQIKNIDEAGYINFLTDYVCEKIQYKKYNGASPKSYLRKIDFSYKKTEKERYHYIDDESIFDASAMEIDTEILEIGEVYTIQATEYLTNRYNDLYTRIIFITDITDDEVKYIECENERVAKKEQRIFNKNVA